MLKIIVNVLTLSSTLGYCEGVYDFIKYTK